MKWPFKPPLGALSANHPLANGLLAAYLNNEGGGGWLHDLTGRNSAQTALSSWTNTPLGPSLKYDGTTNYAEATNFELNAPHRGSLIAYFRTTLTQTSFLIFVPNPAQTNHGISLYLLNTNAVGSDCNNDVVSTTATASRTYADGNIHQLAVTWDGATHKLFFDGILVDSQANTTGFLTARIVRFGAFASGSFMFTGEIPLAYIYQRALTPSEIWQLKVDPFAICFPRRPWPLVHASQLNTLLGLFDPELRREALFDATLIKEGWFDPELIGEAEPVGSISVTPATATLTTTSFTPRLSETTTPSTATLTLSTFAPQVKLSVTPATALLATATFAPTVTATAHISVTPTTATLVTATFAPILKLAVTPSTAALTLTTFEPMVIAAVVLTPATATLSLTTFAPSLALSLTPSTATLTTATFAPALSTGVIPSTASLTTSVFAPRLALSLTPTTGSLTTSLFAPTPNVGVNLIPSTASLSTATFAPTVTATVNVTVTPDTASLLTVGFAPTLNLSLTPTTVSLTTVQFAPTVSATANVFVTPDTLALVTTTFAPTIGAGGMFVITPDTANLALTVFSPQVYVFTSTGSTERTYTVVYESRVSIAEGERITIVSDNGRITVA